MGDHAAHGREDLSAAAEEAVTATDAERRTADTERGRWLFAQECRFVTGAAEEAQLPLTTLPEVAFAGRSNVGKSSLVNALTGRRTLAKVSNTPGRTRQVNFFDLAGRLMLADLPGYGYARASRSDIANWTRLIERYLVGRVPLRRALVLIDARHGIKDVDRQVMGRLDSAAVSYQLVLTKADKLAGTTLDETIARVAADCARHPAAHPEVLATSAESGAGIAEVRAVLARLTDWSAET